MAVTTTDFGTTRQGEKITLYSITNSNQITAQVMNYGAILVNLLVPDKEGRIQDIVLGYDKLEDYYDNDCFFGATIGPSANRVANASFSIDGHTCQLAVNDNQNNLHSDAELGYHKRVWDAKAGEDSVTFTLEDTDGNMGFPGNKKIAVTYTLTQDNELKLTYHAESDRKTLLNMTNHTYFNLAGHDQSSILDHVLWIGADAYTPVVAGAIPTGEIAAVAGTPFDFTEPTAIGARIEADNEQLHLVQGYDHNWVLREAANGLRKAAVVTEPTTGRVMEVYTDQQGMQFYAGNCITPQPGKQGASYGKRCGFALETQAFPDSVNRDNFPDVIYGPDRAYDTVTIYKFINA